MPQTSAHVCDPWLLRDRYHKQEANIFRSRQLETEENWVAREMLGPAGRSVRSSMHSSKEKRPGLLCSMRGHKRVPVVVGEEVDKGDAPGPFLPGISLQPVDLTAMAVGKIGSPRSRLLHRR